MRTIAVWPVLKIGVVGYQKHANVVGVGRVVIHTEPKLPLERIAKVERYGCGEIGCIATGCNGIVELVGNGDFKIVYIANPGGIVGEIAIGKIIGELPLRNERRDQQEEQERVEDSGHG